MKRTPLKRGTSRLKRSPMKRKSSMSSTPLSMSKKRKSPKHKTKYARRERDLVFMRWVKTLPCLLAGADGAGPCTGVVEADHAGVSGIGQKAPDITCIPLCSIHHLNRHAHTGYFRYRTKEWTREWRVAAIAKTQGEYAKCSDHEG